MNVGALIAMLLASGVCAKTDFVKDDGSTLRVVVCPGVVQAPAAPPADAKPETPKEPGDPA